MKSGNAQIGKSQLDIGFEICKSITQKYGTSYYFATQFFPRETRKAIYAAYAFARIPDEIVDDKNLTNKKVKTQKLLEWQNNWINAMKSGWSSDPVLDAIVYTFKKYGIPIEDGEAFLRSMFLDEEKSQYDNYLELEDYMYGSAGVIGLIVTRIVGYSTEEAFPYALKLGYAFQLTNFLRDIREDYEDLGRIYMPVDELQNFDLSRRDVADRTVDERFIAFMKYQISRNREIYREALPGIKMLNWKGRFAVRISYVLYKAILVEIERANYNIFAGRVRTSFGQKVFLSIKAMAGVYE